MAIRDVAAMNASLDNDYGATRGPNAPASHELALFSGDPMLDGVEVAGGGYARVTIPAASWAPAVDGEKALTDAAQLPATTAAWDQSATHWALIASGVMWDCGPLVEELVVTGAGAGPLVEVTVFYADSVEAEEE